MICGKHTHVQLLQMLNQKHHQNQQREILEYTKSTSAHEKLNIEIKLALT